MQSNCITSCCIGKPTRSRSSFSAEQGVIQQPEISMTEEYLYHFKKTRKKRANLFIRMGVGCLVYIAILYLVGNFTDVPKNIHSIILIVLSLSSALLFYIAWWHIKNPATYEAYITNKTLSVSYPENESWTFKVPIEDIEKIEQRQNHSSGGKTILKVGIVMKNSDFHEIVMDYGNSVNKMFKILNSINPEITFPKNVKTGYYLFGNKVK